ncbi:hypothetical protein HYU06_07295 [Candidatus Woesearchaeota archaeon]|nr:hypothetical protein [Candidatus Woesearchaeota archaeon]
MKIFKTKITGALLVSFFIEGTRKTKIIENKLPDDAELIHTKFNWSDNTVELYFSSKIIGTEIPEGASMRECMVLCPVFIVDESIQKCRRKHR